MRCDARCEGARVSDGLMYMSRVVLHVEKSGRPRCTFLKKETMPERVRNLSVGN